MIPTIQKDAYNALSLFGKDIQRFSADKRRVSWRHLWQSEYEEPLAELGRVTGIRGPVIYYPFGGADVHYPFSISPEITDNFCQGTGSFGGCTSIHEYFVRGEGEGYVEKWRQLRSFDLAQDLQAVNHNYRGIGGLIISRLVDTLDAKIEGIYYFIIEQNGGLSFLNGEEVKSLIIDHL